MDLGQQIADQTQALMNDLSLHIKQCALQKIPADLAKDVWNMRQLAALIVCMGHLDKKLDALLKAQGAPA